MNSLLAIGCVLFFVCLLVFFLVYLAGVASDNYRRASNAEKKLEIVKRMQVGMSRPLARGNDLIARLKSRVRKP